MTCLRSLAALLMLVSFGQAPLSADVTIREIVLNNAGDTKPEIERSIFVRGLSMRIDASHGTKHQTTIYDAGAGQIIVLDPGKKRAELLPAAQVASAVELKLPSHRVMTELTATGRSKELLGEPCEEYTFVITAPIGPKSQVLFSLRGSAWIARSGPGLEEYLTFARAADGTGAMIAFANKIASGTRYTAATALATDNIPDALFSVPAGWKTRTKTP
ncbi:MAG: hypothetical protein HYS05_11530 [Acidobacteria bacterium]|nr:hypothetical protein [Acidobacteriota bacterium]